MALVINTNIASLNAQNNLNKSQGQLDQALAQLSSGLRINSPADDPAGYSIAQRMSAQINGFNQAARNANDGISFAQVANGALNTITNSLQSIRTLAIQAANSTNSAQDRQALNDQVQQAIQQVNTTAQDTQFNGQSILNGSLGNLVFQVGANAGQTISVSGLDARGQNLGAAYTDGGSVLNNDLTNTLGSLTVTGTNAAGTQSSATVDMSKVKTVAGAVAAINNASNVTGVYAQQQNTTTGYLAVGTTAGATTTSAQTLTVNGVQISINSGADAAGVASAINSYATQTGVTAKAINNSTSNFIQLSNSTGADITVSALISPGASNFTAGTASAITAVGANATVAGSVSAGTAVASANTTALDKSTSGDTTDTATPQTFSAGVELYTQVGGSVSVSDGTAAATTGVQAYLGLGVGGNGAGSALAAATDLTLNSTNVSTQNDAQTAIKAMDFALTQLSQFGGKLGALQSRFQSTISNLQSASQNTQAARSRIQDANFASATAQLSRAQILQQAGVAMVAQANSQPQVALSLLK